MANKCPVKRPINRRQVVNVIEKLRKSKKKPTDWTTTFDTYKLFLAILECKLCYYYPNEVHDSWSVVPWPNDHIYDEWETKLKRELPTYDTVGFPWDTPEGWFIWKLLSEDKRQTSYVELLTSSLQA